MIDIRQKKVVVVLAVAVSIGIGMILGQYVPHLLRFYDRLFSLSSGANHPRIPLSKLSGPPREKTCRFELNPAQAGRMTGLPDRDNERCSDISGNFYSSDFLVPFSYTSTAPDGPAVYVSYVKRGPVFAGRLEAHRLKPNFAYQIKLYGDPAYLHDFETIGYLGRWRLPGRGTNYSDDDYRKFPDKAEVQAYILFDYFVTNADGNAARDFELDSTLHVLWNDSRQRACPEPANVTKFTVNASNPRFYARPKKTRGSEGLWLERESGRYKTADDVIRLPPGQYHAFLVLTEESFHSSDNDGGHWATVLRLPVEFEIVPETR